MLPSTPQAQAQTLVQAVPTMKSSRSAPESQEITQSSHELSQFEEVSDPSYENLDVTRGEFLKRQKLDGEF